MVEPITTAGIPADLASWADHSPLYGYVHADTQRLLVIGNAQTQAEQLGARLLGWLEPAHTPTDGHDHDAALVVFSHQVIQ